MRPGRCSADLRNLRIVSFFRVSFTGSVHRGGSPGRSVKRASLTGTKRQKRGERTWQSRAAWWGARSHPRRAETPPSRPRGRPRTPCQPWGSGGRGDRKRRGGAVSQRSSADERDAEDGTKLGRGSREMLHPRRSRDERGRTGVMCGMVSPGNVAAMVMKSFAACETCMGSISSGARHRPETNGARRRVAKTFDRNGSVSDDARVVAPIDDSRPVPVLGSSGMIRVATPQRSARGRTPGLAAARTMSELLRRWLRDDVGVTQHMDSFESAFASGFLFGEILARCNVQPDFAKFVNKNTPDARINNFTRLQVRRRGRLLRGMLLDAARPARGSRSRRRAARVPRRNARVPSRGTRETSFGSVNPRNIVRFPWFRSSVARSLVRLETHALTPSLIIIRTSSLTTISRPCKRWASPWTRAR